MYSIIDTLRLKESTKDYDESYRLVFTFVPQN